MMSRLRYLTFSVALFSGFSNADDGIPVVPASVMAVAAEAARTVAVNSESQKDLPVNGVDGANLSKDSVITITPGVNQIIPVAIGYPNRIVTPFGDPEVVTTSLAIKSKDGECGEVCIKDNVLYVATGSESPVTMFITEKGSEAQALSLTLVPRRIPPREIFLKLHNQTVAAGMYSSQRANRWEQSQPYVETIRSVFRSLALGEIPQGYTMTETPDNIAPPVCSQEGASVTFKNGQMLMGFNLSVFVGVAKNTSKEIIEFQEATCGDWDIAAVTTWPHKVLEPGQKTEVFVARKMTRGKAPTSSRASLIGGL